jgi:hypothetical protein
MPSSTGASRARRRSPASVKATLRVVRFKSRTPRLRSSDFIEWLSDDGAMPSSPAARRKLRLVATSTNALRS